MRVGDLPPAEIARRLRGSGLTARTGPLIVRLRSGFPSVAAYVTSHYRSFPLEEAAGAHFTVDVSSPSLLRRWVRPQALFAGSGHAPFYPLPAYSAPALLEWGFNWCVHQLVHHLLVVHCAVVSRRGRAVMLPAPPGSGKSTLCAALVAHGWQLGSDEFGLINLQDGTIQPLPRPLALKEASIAIIGRRWHDARFGPEVLNVEGARVRYLEPPVAAVADGHRSLRARWVVLPRYEAGSATRLEPVTRARMLTHLADSSYNFSQFGVRGFECLAGIIDRSRVFTLTYSDLDEAMRLFDRLDQEADA